jgi:hypothetical protein
MAQAAQRQDRAAFQLAVEVGQAATEPQLHLDQLGPALPAAVQEPLAQRDLGGVGDRPGHRLIIADRLP